MTEDNSYFHNVSHPISKIRSIGITPHLEYVGQAYSDDSLFHKMIRRKYSREVNEWLKYPFINSENSYEEIFENEKLVINRDVCITIYKDLLQAIYSSGYEIDDINQFKEDFIYYMYILSDNTRY